jgi:hypothetical protein
VWPVVLILTVHTGGTSHGCRHDDENPRVYRLELTRRSPRQRPGPTSQLVQDTRRGKGWCRRRTASAQRRPDGKAERRSRTESVRRPTTTQPFITPETRARRRPPFCATSN